MKHVAAYLLVRGLRIVETRGFICGGPLRAGRVSVCAACSSRGGVSGACVCSVIIGGAPGGREGEHGWVLCHSLGGSVMVPVRTPAVPGQPLPPSGG